MNDPTPKTLFITRLRVPAAKAYSTNVLRVAESIERTRPPSLLVARGNSHLTTRNNLDSRELDTGQPPRIKLTSKSNVCFFMTVFVLLRRHKHAQLLVYSREPEVCIIAQLLGIKTGLHLHTVYGGTALGFLRNLIIRHMSFPILVVSEGMRKYLIHRHAIPPERLHLIRNGVKLSDFSPELSADTACAKLGIKKVKPVCLYTGSLHEGRGIDIILECARSLPDIDFVIVGGDPTNLCILRSRAPKNVTLTGHQPFAAIPLYLQCADVLLMPYQHRIGLGGNSSHDASIIGPLKLYEYISAGRPIIASRVPGIAEVLPPDGCVYADPDDHGQWTRAIRSLIADPILAKKLSDYCASMAPSFDIDGATRSALQIIQT